MGPRAGLDRCGKISPPPGFDPPTVQPIASRYIDYATRPTKSTTNIYIMQRLRMSADTLPHPLYALRRRQGKL